jgi:phosphatidylglycerol:prolipoprotein diacylglycerol transferase
MLAIAIMAAGWLTARDAKARLGIEPDTIYDLVFWVVLLGIVGARMFYVLLNWSYFVAEPLEIVMVQKGGLAWQGSLLAGLIAGVVYIKRKKLPSGKLLDVAAPYIALGHAIGRIGCLLNGCCYGKPAAWGLYFPIHEARLIPTQIFMSLGQVAIFIALRALQPKSRRDGQVFVWYLLLSAIERFVVEFFRDDHQLYGGLSIFQYVCIGIFLVTLGVNAWIQKQPLDPGNSQRTKSK